MKMKHHGFTIVGMTGGISAEITEDVEYTRVNLIGVGANRSLDLTGLRSLIEDLETVQELAGITDRMNQQNRGDAE